MDGEQLKAAQAPLKQRYREDPDAALVTLHARGAIGDGVTCSVETGQALARAGLHPATGGEAMVNVCSGDMLLQAVAERLRRTARKTDMIVRFGGDEFVVLQSPLNSLDEASTLARRMLTALASTYEIDGHQVVISGTIGIAFSPRDGTDPDQILRHADMALYRAKAERRGSWRFFRTDMEANAQARRSLELDLRNALENDTFKLHYQPLVELKTRRILGCEALLRWPHPERGMISPGEFIPIAEEMGLIVEIGKRVLRKACQECRNWPGDIRVAVNLSPSG